MNRLVLIADQNADRAQRLAQACDAVGILSRAATHGAQALEVALDARPSLVVARLDLPLVDGLKLAEILRANPRTRSARFLFLGSEGRTPRAGGVGDVVLPSTAAPGDILPAVQELIAVQDRIEHLHSEAAQGDAEGDLGQLPLAELLQLFHLNRQHGRLNLEQRTPDGQRADGSLLIRDGEIIQAQTGKVSGPKALFRLLAWGQGRFHFAPGRGNDAPHMLVPTRALLLEGLRQLDEHARLADQLPALDAEARLKLKSAELPNIVHPLTQEVLLLLELYSRVRDVVDHCSFPDYQVLRTLHTLTTRGIVEVRRGRPARIGPAADVVGLFDEAQLRRLRSWLRGVAPGEGWRVDGKILVAASEPSGILNFVRLIEQVPGIEVSRSAREGDIPAEGLTPLARVGLEDGFGLQLLHVPVSARMRPLWPIAGHGALGTLFLLTGGVGEAAEKLHEASQALQKLPRSRLFHVVMLGKGERISPDELRENLSLIDEASIFLLPLESAKKPAALLRSLFARIVP